MNTSLKHDPINREYSFFPSGYKNNAGHPGLFFKSKDLINWQAYGYTPKSGYKCHFDGAGNYTLFGGEVAVTLRNENA